ncbi:unnamed protein product [Prunus armeniaca]|uniref:Uncharacterized protein n=1 Tax=Prunus armeniaca TaxID=36596 RepID=A0A6J5WLF7_PRUAR|nr:unnamed protein product [Prunus armeniaca]
MFIFWFDTMLGRLQQVVAGRKGLPEVDIWHCVIDLEGVAFLFSTFQQSSSLIERRRLVRMLEDILFEILMLEDILFEILARYL